MSQDLAAGPPPGQPPRSWTDRFLNAVEWLGNKLPDPAILFLICLLLTWGASAWLSQVQFTEIDPRTVGTDPKTGQPRQPRPIQIENQLTGEALATFLSRMVENFAQFPPLGLVLVALLGVGVADHTGFINACLKGLLSITPERLLTPMLILVAILSHTAGDSGYVLVIPLGGVIFYAAGRHPLAGIAAAFAGVSGGFSASFIPTGLDPLLQGFTQSAARIVDQTAEVNALCNWFFTSAACLPIVLIGWWVTDRVIEPRLTHTRVDGDPADMPRFDPLTPEERLGMWAGLGAMLLMVAGLVAVLLPEDSVMRAPNGALTSHSAPLMRSLIPLIFLFFLVPGVVYGYVAGTVKSHRDIVKGMTRAMSTMGYYLVLVFFAAQFTYAFNQSNVGVLLAVKGAETIRGLGVPPVVTVLCLILMTTMVNLLIGSASAKWALLGPIFVPMLMSLGLSAELTQAAYRVGDSCTNIITPLNPYFALVVMYCQRYVKGTGIGTLVALMLPYSLAFLGSWTLLLLGFWAFDLPLGLDAGYHYMPPRG
ncbi:MAG: AbgT family transporter [Gemmataceae bacterium]|nr:AbgT family transporter [Gemmataceae bacterium]